MLLEQVYLLWCGFGDEEGSGIHQHISAQSGGGRAPGTVHVQLDEGGVWFRVVVAKCIHGIKFEGPLLPHDCHLHVINAVKSCL